MKIRSTLRKLGAAASSALLIGATMGTAATLTDYPELFVEDGALEAEVVVGTGGSVTDVVSAVTVAASLGQATNQLTQRTAQVEGASGWQATSGTTLSTTNDQLHFGDQIDRVRQTLTGQHLDALRDTTFTDATGTSQSIEQFISLGDQAIAFGAPGDDDQDPFLYVESPSDVTASSYLYRLQANFGEGLTLDPAGTEPDGNADGDQDVLGETVELFGETLTIAPDSFTGNGQLVLYGSSQEYDLETGGSQEFTINGTSHTIAVRAVTGPETVAISVDGTLREQQEGESFYLDGQTVRVSDVVQTNTKNAQGVATFSIGSQEYVLQDGEPVQDGDGNEIKGTHVELTGTGVTSGNTNTLSDDSAVEIGSIEISVGATDTDSGYVKAGEVFQDPVFEEIAFRFSGLTPEAAGGGPDVGQVSVTQGDSEAAALAYTGPSGTSRTTTFVHRDLNAGTNELADSEGDRIVVVEGNDVRQDENMVTDAGGFGHIFEVTDISVDAASSSSGDEATVELQDRVSSTSVTVDLSADEDVSGYGGSDEYVGTEVIDGQTYYFSLDTRGTTGTGDDQLEVTWGTGASYGATGGTGSGVATVYPSLETTTGSLLSLVDPDQAPTSLALGTALVDFQASEFFVDATGNTPEGANGYSNGEPILRVINDHDGTVDTGTGDDLLSLGSRRYADIDGSNSYTSGDEVYTDDDSDGQYTSATDGGLAGASPEQAGAGTILTTTNPWSSATNPVAFIDDGDNLWESGSDLLLVDNADGGTVSTQKDQALHTGTDTAVDAAAGTALEEFIAKRANAFIDDAGDGFTAGTDDDVVADHGGFWTYSAAADTKLAGTAPGDNATLQSNNQFTGEPAVQLIDGGTAGTWESGSDVILEDTDQDDVVTVNADTKVDNSGSDGLSAGAALTDFSASPSKRIAVEGSDTTWSSGEKVVVDTDQDGVYTARNDTLLDSDGSTSTNIGALDATAGTAITTFPTSTNVTFTGDFSSSWALWVDSANTTYNSADTVIVDNGVGLVAGTTTGSRTDTNTTIRFYDSSGNSAWDSGEDILADRGGTGTVSTSADTAVSTDSATDGAQLTLLDGTGNLVFNDAGGTTGDWDIGEDIFDESVDGELTYSSGADNRLAGVTLGNAPATAGAALTTTNPWTGDDANNVKAVMFYDGGTGGQWEQGSDAIIVDDDEDDVYTSQSDYVIADGGEVSRDPGDPLLTFETHNGGQLKQTDPDNNGVFTTGDEIVVDYDTDGQYTAQPDNQLNGISLATAGQGSAVTTANPFTNAPQVAFNDTGSLGTWDPASSNDTIIKDRHNGGTVSTQADPTINLGSDGTVDATDGATLADIDETEYYAADVGDDASVNTGDEIVQAVEGSISTSDSVTGFAASTKHTGNQPYNTGEFVVKDNDGSDTYDSGDHVFGGSNLAIRYHSSQPSAVSGLTSAAVTLRNGLTKPSVMLIQEPDSQDDQEAYAVTPRWDGTDGEMEVGGADTPAAVSFSGTRTRVQKQSDSDVYVSYDQYGTHVTEDTSGTGGVRISTPETQATAGVAFTGSQGDLSVSGLTNITYTALAQPPRQITDIASTAASMDSPSQDLILVGGPAVNALVQRLASQGKTWTAEQWRNQHQGDAVLQLVEDAFGQGNHALIVAGYTASDTDRAAEYIANYAQHQQALSQASDGGRRLVVPE